MLMPINVLLSIVLLPFTLIVARPRKVRLCKQLLLDKTLVKEFPVASRTPILILKPWGWYQKWMLKKKIGAQAFGCFVVKGENANETTLFHEAVHVMQQSIFTPILVGLSFLLDVLMYLPFRKRYQDFTWRKIPVVEMTARNLADQEDWRKK